MRSSLPFDTILKQAHKVFRTPYPHVFFKEECDEQWSSSGWLAHPGRPWLHLLGNCTPNQNLACFALYLKSVSTFFAKWCIHLKANCPNLKNGIGIFVGQAIFKLWIKAVKILFWSITWHNRLAYLEFNAVFEFLWQFTIRCVYYFSKRCWQFWDRAQNVLSFGFGVQFPLNGPIPRNSFDPKIKKKKKNNNNNKNKTKALKSFRDTSTIAYLNFFFFFFLVRPIFGHTPIIRSLSHWLIVCFLMLTFTKFQWRFIQKLYRWWA